MGFFDFLKKPIPGLNKPNPQTVKAELRGAAQESDTHARQGDKENAFEASDAPEWNAYTQTLFSKMPFLEKTLRAGVSENSIKTAEAELGFGFPKELKNLYLSNDGDNNEAVCGMMLGFRFLSLEGMLSVWRSMKNVPQYADKRWLSFGSDSGGNFIGVNLDPDDSGKAERIVFFGRDEQEETVIADSLGALFERFTRIIMSKDFYIGEYDGEEVILLGTDDVDEGSYLIDYLESENSVK